MQRKQKPKQHNGMCAWGTSVYEMMYKFHRKDKETIGKCGWTIAHVPQSENNAN